MPGNSRVLFKMLMLPPSIFGLLALICSLSFAQAIIIDHSCTDLSKIPESWIDKAKNQLRLCYGHTSHGSQPVTGMEVLMNDPSNNHLYDFNTNGAVKPGVLSLDDYTPDGDLGENGDTSWADRTRSHLNGSGSDRNVVVWSWCGGVSDNTNAGINAYLSAMNELETQYPSVTFVYMTGHLDGTGEAGNLHIRNNQIRNYCKANNKVLFDFADIESYDPDGAYFLSLGADDGCYYNGGANNWAMEWCDSHSGSDLCKDCGGSGCCAHSEPLNCNLKARAFWWMLARIAGWSGTVPCSTDPVRIAGSTPVYYTSLQSAYNAAVNGDIIQCRAVDFAENLNFNLNKSVTIEGGYNCNYTARSGGIVIKGSMNIRDRKVVFK